MAEKVSITYLGGQGPSVDVRDPDNTGRDLATDVNEGNSIEVPKDVAERLLEQESNWTLTKAEKPKAQAEKESK